MSLTFYIENLIGAKPHLFNPFNYITFSEYGSYEFKYTSPSLLKIECSTPATIPELKFTNNPIKNWVDFWCESESNLPIDPRIEKMNLSNNSELEIVSFGEERSALTTLMLNQNKSLSYVNVVGCNALTHLDLSGCTNLTTLNLGTNRNLKMLSLRGCNLTDDSLERALGHYYPTVAPLDNHFKKKLGAYLDLRGNYINWSNTKIASKIRMLLTNNILVLWDENPPDFVIPITYYKTLNKWQTYE